MTRRLHNSYVVNPLGCWIWTGSVFSNGYGSWAGQLAHRRSYRMKYGAIPSEIVLMHKCNNRKCVNPDHLRPGSQLENMRLAVAQGRTAAGARNGGAKLSEEDVIQVRLLAAIGVPTQKLAEQFGIGARSIRRIISGERWKSV